MLLKRTCILTASVVLFLLSCNSISDEEIKNYREIDATLTRSNEEIESAVRRIFRDFEDKMTDPATRDKASYWNKKADSVRSICEIASQYIADLKMNLKAIADLQIKDSAGEEYDERSTSVVKKLFSERNLQELEKIITNCRKQTLAVDPGFIETFQHTLPIGRDSLQESFKGLSAIAAVTRLTKIQSDLKVSEKMLVTYCFRHVPISNDGYDQFFPMTFGHNSVYYPGEKAEINAGIGAFMSKPLREIIINGKKAEVTPEGYYQYRFKVSDQPGTYKTVVRINYVDPNTGQPSQLKKVIEYRVIPKCPEL